MAKCKKELNEKLDTQTPRAGTQNAAVQENNEITKSIASISLEVDGMPSREELLELLGYQWLNIALVGAESDGDYKGTLNRIGMFNQDLGESKHVRLKLCDWKLYLDSYVMYHLVFADWCLNDIHE